MHMVDILLSYIFSTNPVTPGSYPGCSIHADEISTGSTLHYWHFENAEGLFLIDADTGASLTDSAVFSIDVGDTADVDSLGLIISNEGSWGSTLFWSSSDTSVATVDPYTGTVYGLKRGKCTITATQTINDLVYERKYTLRVLEVIYVQNFYDTTITSGILELIDDSVNFLNDVYISVNLRFEMAGEPLPNPFDPTNNEPCLSDPCTEGFGTGAWLEHHKDVYLIAKKFTKEYYERNHVIVTWSDCWSAQSKFTYCYHDSRTDCHSHSLLNAYGYTVNCPGSEPKKFFPVAQILTITKYKDDGTITYETSKYMKLVLAHEIAHVLGLDEIYSKRYEDCDDETVDKHKYASVDCVMAKLSGDISSFVDAVEEKNAAFCPYCQRKIEELISDRDLFVDGEFDSFLTN